MGTPAVPIGRTAASAFPGILPVLCSWILLHGEAEGRQVFADFFFQLCRFGELLRKRSGEAFDFLIEELAISGYIGGADIAAGREDVAIGFMRCNRHFGYRGPSPGIFRH